MGNAGQSLLGVGQELIPIEPKSFDAFGRQFVPAVRRLTCAGDGPAIGHQPASQARGAITKPKTE